MPLNFTLALRNLFHDRVRFIATMIGIVFAVVLVMVQMGLYLGFGRMVTTMIDNASADLWVVRRGTKCFEDPSLLDASVGKDIQATPGVADVQPLVIGFAGWRLSTGEMTPVFVVGSDLKARTFLPWNIVEGSLDDLAADDAVAVDRSYFKRLGASGLGSKADIGGAPVRVAVVTDGIRSFTTTPYVFADIKRAQAYTRIPESKLSYLLVRLAPGADAAKVRDSLQAKDSKVEVLTTQEFRDRSRSFWLFGTGAGAALFAGAILGIIVGMVIVAQTLYSSTKDHLEEFATLRAMGSSKNYVYRVIVYQALLNAFIGFCLASVIGFAVVAITAKGALPVVITPGLIAGMLTLTVVMCIAAAIAAIVRVVRMDPAMVFTR